jgi:hypothetical protein
MRVIVGIYNLLPRYVGSSSRPRQPELFKPWLQQHHLMPQANAKLTKGSLISECAKHKQCDTHKTPGRMHTTDLQRTAIAAKATGL